MPVLGLGWRFWVVLEECGTPFEPSEMTAASQRPALRYVHTNHDRSDGNTNPHNDQDVPLHMRPLSIGLLNRHYLAERHLMRARF
jgi:hypothetical protein